MFYLFDCAQCDGDDIPFDTPESRQHWKESHQQATGHDLFVSTDTNMNYQERAIYLALKQAPH